MLTSPEIPAKKVSLTTVKDLFALSFPIILGQLGQMLIGAGDVYVASLHSTSTVAAIGVANGFINPVFLFGIGLTMGVSPVLSIKIGRGENMRSSLVSVLAFALLAGTFLALAMTGLNGFLVEAAGIEPELIAPVKEYISIVSWSFPFALVFQAGKEYLQAFEEVVVPNLMALAAVALNIVVNYGLVFGLFGFKGMGMEGLAWASLIIRIVLCLALLFVLAKEKLEMPSAAFIKDIFRLGLPTAFMFFLEVLAFCAVSVLSGKLGIVPAATNNIVMTLASITFMIPLSVSSAAAVKVGNAFGAKNAQLLEESAKAAMFISLSFTVVSAALFYLFPVAIMSITSADSEVVELGVQVLFIVALFQIVDGLQVTFAGILRGVERALQTASMVFVGYWFLGIPLGVFLAFNKDWGVAGLWTGIATALTILAVSLGVYTWLVLRKSRVFLAESLAQSWTESK